MARYLYHKGKLYSVDQGTLPQAPRGKGYQVHQLPKEYEDIVVEYFVDKMMSTRMVAKALWKEYRLKVSYTPILRVLKERGIDTSRKGLGGFRDVVCDTCGRPKRVIRSIARNWSGHYCNWTCKRIDMEEHSLQQMHARWYVEQLLKKPLPRDAVVHFINDDFKDIRKENLRVFLSRERHLEEHGIIVDRKEG